ncbi:MAG TPA: fatty acid desaturase, partial [Lautropia sp.]|nr:fatty acid desaturase [Lautropia sp.]
MSPPPHTSTAFFPGKTQAPAAFRLKAADLMPLSVRTDTAAAWRALGHLGAIAAAILGQWYALGTWWTVPLTVLLGYMLAFLFTLLHETAHQTAFRTRAWNYVLGHLAGFAILLPYEYYRAFHWEHHRHTQDPQRDPELAVPLPRSKAGLLWVWSGIPMWISRLKLFFNHGVLGRVSVPWVPEEKRSLIVLEARSYLAGYSLIFAASVMAGSLAVVWLWLLPLAVGQVFLRPYLLAEHTGCADTPNMLENTRTTYTSAFVHFFAWNMPYHAEHHAYPAVPFHALPRLNSLLAKHIVNTENG